MAGKQGMGKARRKVDGKSVGKAVTRGFLFVVTFALLLAMAVGKAFLAWYGYGILTDVMCSQAATRMSADIDSCAVSTTATVLPSDADHVPLCWDLILTGTDQALAQDIRARMLGTDASGMGCAERLLATMSGNPVKAMHGLYSDHPEMSVFTDGEYQSYGDIELSDDERKHKVAEMETVTRKADELSASIDAEIRDLRKRRSWMSDSDDYLYAMRVCQRLGMATTYSDGIDDSEHENDVYGALVEGESRCYGVACAAKALLDRKGIPSFVATGSCVGSDGSGRHAITIAWIDDQWHILDVTAVQSKEVPETIDAACIGYWGSIAFTYDCYVKQMGFEPDQECIDLMQAYADARREDGRGGERCGRQSRGAIRPCDDPRKSLPLPNPFPRIGDQGVPLVGERPVKDSREGVSEDLPYLWTRSHPHPYEVGATQPHVPDGEHRLLPLDLVGDLCDAG